MAVTFLAGADTVKRYAAKEEFNRARYVGVSHYYECPHAQEHYGQWHMDKERRVRPDCSRSCRKHWRVTMYEGRVLSTYERNGPSDSDWYAIVWRDDGSEHGALHHHNYATTRGASSGAAKVDATEDVMAKAERILEHSAYVAMKAKDAEAARAIEWGRNVTVVRGRKVPKGTVGRVEWVGEGQWGLRARIQTPAGDEYWTSASNLEVVSPAEYETPDAVLRDRARHHASQRRGRVMGRTLGRGEGEHEPYIVEAYPLTDSADHRYSRGIHTVHLRSLATGRTRRVSAVWFEEKDY